MEMNGICLNCFSQRGDFEVCPYCGYIDGTPPPQAYLLHPGVRLWGRYIIGTVLGVGGFGATYKAWDTRLNTLVAIKEFFPQNLVSRIPGEVKVRAFSGEKMESYAQQLARFMDEARNMAKFNGDKHIVGVFDFFEDNGTAYIVMEYLDGETLKEHQAHRGGTLPPEEAMAVTEALLSAMDSIHEKGIIHRDISPDNIFILRDGRVKVLDFGAARFAVRENSDLTQTVVVKKGYAPPEQYRNNMKQGVWTDIYAVGATLYKMLTGITPEESIERTEKDTLKKPSAAGAAVDTTVDKVVMKAMALRPELRFKSAKQMLAALQNQTTIDFPEQEMKKRRRTRGLVSALAVVMVIAAGALVAWELNRAGPVNLGPTLADAEIEPDTVTILFQDYSEQVALYQSLADAFNQRYPDYKVELMPAEYEVIESTIVPAWDQPGAPTILRAYEYDEHATYKNYGADLSLLVGSLDMNDYYFLDDYKTHYPEGNLIPLSFYFLTAYGSDAKAAEQGVTLPDKFTSFGQLLDVIEPAPAPVDMSTTLALRNMRAFEPNVYKNGNFKPGLIEDELRRYIQMYQDGGFDTSGETYHQRYLWVYYGEAYGLRRSQDIWSGSYRIIPMESGGRTTAYLGDHWCVNKSASENQQKVAMLFLHFMLSEYGQHTYLVQNEGDIPLNKTVLDQYTNIYTDLAPYLTPSAIGKLDVYSNYGEFPLPDGITSMVRELLESGATEDEVVEAFREHPPEGVAPGS